MNQLEHFIYHNIDATVAQRKKIAASFRPQLFARNKILLHAAEVCRHFYFVKNGCARTYYLSRQGHEKTRFVAFEGMFIGSLASFITQSPSFEYIETLEKSELLTVERSRFFELVEEIPGWKTFYLHFMEQAYVMNNKKLEQLVTLTAKQRYMALFNQNPMFVQRLSNKMVASYLDISQETLSRLKSK